MGITDRTFTTPQVAEIIGVTQRKLISFLERGYVTPSVQDAAGHGSKRLWNFTDVIRCAVIRFLMNQTAATLREVGEQIGKGKSVRSRCGLYIFPPADGETKALVMHVGPVKANMSIYGALTHYQMKSPAVTVIDFEDVRRWVKTRVKDT